jgi:hypothetical protein
MSGRSYARILQPVPICGPDQGGCSFFRMRNRKLNVILVVIHDESGFDKQAHDELDREIRSWKPDFHEFVGDHSFHIVFRNDVKSSYQAEMFIRKMETLTREHPGWGGMKIGRQAGEALCLVDAFGRIRSIPIGIVACEAMKAVVS